MSPAFQNFYLTVPKKLKAQKPNVLDLISSKLSKYQTMRYFDSLQWKKTAVI